jgi:hypothetical protein
MAFPRCARCTAGETNRSFFLNTKLKEGFAMKQAQNIQKESFKIKLIPQSVNETAKFAVWRADYYICTGICYAKSLGKTVDDFVSFLGESHTWETMRDQGLEPPVQLLYFVIKSYEGGEFEILSESENSVEMKCNRPYARYFDDNAMLGVSLGEFEACLWQHIIILAKRIDLDFSYRIEGDSVLLNISK